LDCPLGPRKKWKFRATPDKAFGRRCRFRYLLCGAKVEPKLSLCELSGTTFCALFGI